MPSTPSLHRRLRSCRALRAVIPFALAAAAVATLATPTSSPARVADMAQGVPQSLPKVALQAGMHLVQAAVARTPEQRQIGLMYRRDLPQHEGMLFVFDTPGTQCFYMRNTPLPLSIAFLADDGSVVNIADMQPQTLDSHCSAKPVRFALEMNQGWFARRGVKPGSRLTGPPFAPR